VLLLFSTLKKAFLHKDNSPLIRRSEPKLIHRHFLDVVLATTRRCDEQQQWRPAPLPLLSMIGRTTIFWTGTFCVLFDGATVKQWGANYQLMPVAASLMILWQVQVLSKDQLAQFPSLAVSKGPFSLCCCAGNTVRVWVWGGKGSQRNGRKKERKKKKCNFSPRRCGVSSHRTRCWCTPDTRRQDPLTF